MIAMAVYTHVAPGNGSQGPLNPTWRAFIGPIARDEAEQMAARRYIRERGGFMPEELPHTFTVWSYTDTTPLHDNGKPRQVHAVTLVAHPEKS